RSQFIRRRELPARRDEPAPAGGHSRRLPHQDSPDHPGGAVMRAKRLLLAAVTGLALAASIGCPPAPVFPTARPDDAGNYAWARQVIPILLGRKARGRDEVKAIGDLASATDRPTVVRALTKHPEFLVHWSEVLTDILRVDREGERVLDDCYGSPR